MSAEILVTIVAVCVLCALCALVVTVMCLWALRNLRTEIRSGDNSVKDHGDRELRQIRDAVGRIEENQTRREEQIGEMQESIARIEASSEVDDRHVLRPRDLGGIHEKINTIALDVAGLKGKSDAQFNALREQLTLLQRTLTRTSRP
jgi:septal ring factor EnvC (AmiA/AmiB activator)